MPDRLIGGLTSQDLESSAPGRLVFVQKAFVVDNDRLLLVQKSSSDPYYPEYWEVPGGRMKPKENPDDHIRRETWEETRILVEPGAPFHIWQWFMPDAEAAEPSAWVQAIAVGRLCRLPSAGPGTPRHASQDYLSLGPSTVHQVRGDHLSQARWVPIAEVPGFQLIPGVDDAVRMFLNLQKDEALAPLLAF
jgi:8-oxo-dGTP pyrophosphatase MutT (NUDIX family)